MYNILDQKNISPKNIKMLKSIAEKYEGDLSEQALLLMRIGELRPRKKKRIGYLYHNHRSLYDKLVIFGLIENYIEVNIANELEEERYIQFLKEQYNETIAEDGKTKSD